MTINNNKSAIVGLTLLILMQPVRVDALINLNKISFIQAMEPNEQFIPSKSLSDDRWKFIYDLYNTYVMSDQFRTEEPRIPKIFHHIWVGSPFPEKYKQLRQTWIDKHPDWEFILWTDEKIEAFGLQNKKIYDVNPNFGSKADIARYEILYRMGGVYLDTDFECLHPLDELNHRLNFYTAIGFEKDVELYNGLIASVPGHPILRECIDNIKPLPAKPDSVHIFNTTGPYYFTRCFFKIVYLCENEPLAVLPTSFFYPWPHFLRNDPNPRRWIRNDSFALHYWHVSWL